MRKQGYRRKTRSKLILRLNGRWRDSSLSSQNLAVLLPEAPKMLRVKDWWLGSRMDNRAEKWPKLNKWRYVCSKNDLMEVIMVPVEEAAPVLPLNSNSKNHHSSSSSTFQQRILKLAAPTNLSLLNPFKWRMCNKDSQVYHQDKQLPNHRWPPESPTISLCHQEDPKVVPAVRYADHPSSLQQHL